MAFKKGEILTGKEKKVKNKKLQSIREANTNITIKDSADSIIIEIKLDRVLEPAPRARFSGIYKTNESGNKEMVGGRMYDPLSAYKDYLKGLFRKEFTEESLGIQLPFEGRISVDLAITKQPSKSWSDKDKYYALKGELPFLAKPDVDNVEKTLYDCLNKILFKDDAQITTNKTDKKYDYTDSTYAVFRLWKDKPIPKGRLTKSQQKEWEQMKKKLIYKLEENKNG